MKEYKLNNQQEKHQTHFFFYLNAAIQLAAILTFQQLGIMWPLYIVMGMLGILIVMQTLAAGFLFSNIAPMQSSHQRNKNSGIAFLISIIYMVSCYNIYLIGYVAFAWFASAHVIIQLLATIFGAMKNDSSSLHSDEK